MRLLIVTQAVDETDPILGFFCRWIEEFAKHFEFLEVICLYEGGHHLPGNVRVHSLGKEKGRQSRFIYALRFGKLIWKLRSWYDAVFVHMNPEYVVLGALDWKIMGKPVALWYTHKSVTPALRIATYFADAVFTASPESFRIESPKVQVVGHGIDTDFFTPDPRATRTKELLSAGRLSPVKRHDLAIRAAALLERDLRIAGTGSEHAHLAELARELGIDSKVHFTGALSPLELRTEYRRAAVFIHTSETGSLDKVVLEALACGLPVVSTSIELAALPIMIAPVTPQGIAEAVEKGSSESGESLARYVREHHALSVLVPAILAAYE